MPLTRDFQVEHLEMLNASVALDIKYRYDRTTEANYMLTCDEASLMFTFNSPMYTEYNSHSGCFVSYSTVLHTLA